MGLTSPRKVLIVDFFVVSVFPSSHTLLPPVSVSQRLNLRISRMIYRYGDSWKKSTPPSRAWKSSIYEAKEIILRGLRGRKQDQTR